MQSLDTVKRKVPANERLTIVTAEPRDPVVIFSEPPALLYEFAIDLSGGVGNLRKKPELAIALEKAPCVLIRIEKDSQLPDADNSDQKAPGAPGS